MTVQKVIPKDPKKENEKYLIFLDYALDKLKKGRPSGILLRNLASDYKSEMGTTLDNSEQKEFMQLYNGLYFDKANNSIDRIKIRNETIRILLEYGSIREYLKQQENKSFSSYSSSFEHLNNSGKIQNRNKRVPIFGAIIYAIVSLSPIWKIIISIIVAGLGTLLGYILIEWYKLLNSV